MKITRKKSIELFNTLSNFKGTYNKVFSMYLVLNNKKMVPFLQEIQDIQNSAVPSQEYLDLQQKELDIVNKYVDKDESGKPMIIGNGGFKIKKEFFEVYTKEKQELIDNNESIITEYKKLEENVNMLLEEEIDIDFMMIPFDSIPEEIAVKELEILSIIIQDFGKVKE